MPFLETSAAASSAPPSWFSPSVITIIARPTPSACVKLLLARFIALAMSVPCWVIIDGDIASRNILAETLSLVIGSWL